MIVKDDELIKLLNKKYLVFVLYIFCFNVYKYVIWDRE